MSSFGFTLFSFCRYSSNSSMFSTTFIHDRKSSYIIYKRSLFCNCFFLARNPVFSLPIPGCLCYSGSIRRILCRGLPGYYGSTASRIVGGHLSMISHGKDMAIFTGNANPALAKDICSALFINPGNCSMSQFADGECSVSV
ncbi:MAG: ribose-phosphate pyrophosphokinase-like domain-containing protein, partial [Bacteroidales bacterium]|nr:ribose-phosphate pyrophosphokinase-like domain-containing protein [Bacteroidales bacterium]